MPVHQRLTPLQLIRRYPFILLGGDRHYQRKVPGPRTRCNAPGQGWISKTSALTIRPPHSRDIARKEMITTEARLAREEIKEHTINEWRHVHSHQNTSYLSRRGSSTTDAAFWWSGPKWLLLQCEAAKPCDYSQ